jgi:hypothetical protein
MSSFGFCREGKLKSFLLLNINKYCGSQFPSRGWKMQITLMLKAASFMTLHVLLKFAELYASLSQTGNVSSATSKKYEL